MKRKLLIAVPLLALVTLAAWMLRPKRETQGEAVVSGVRRMSFTELAKLARERGQPLTAAGNSGGTPRSVGFNVHGFRVAVNKATEGRQTPWESSSLTEDFRFVAGAAPGSPAAANAGPSFQAAMSSGKFHGMIWATTPTGSRSV